MLNRCKPYLPIICGLLFGTGMARADHDVNDALRHEYNSQRRSIRDWYGYQRDVLSRDYRRTRESLECRRRDADHLPSHQRRHLHHAIRLERQRAEREYERRRDELRHEYKRRLGQSRYTYETRRSELEGRSRCRYEPAIQPRYGSSHIYRYADPDGPRLERRSKGYWLNTLPAVIGRYLD